MARPEDLTPGVATFSGLLARHSQEGVGLRTPLPRPPAKREFEYVQHGTRALIASFAVPTGEVVWDLGRTRTAVDFAAHFLNVAEHFSDFERFDWVVDNLNTHYHMKLCEAVAAMSDLPFEPQRLTTGRERRAFLSDPSHKHVFHLSCDG